MIFRAFFKMLHINMKESTYKVLLQFIKFGIVGVSNTLVYYILNLITLLLVRDLALEKDYIIGNIIGFILSVLWSFYWNNKLVFKKEESEKRNLYVALARTYASYAFTGLVLSNIISYVLIDIFSVSKYIVPIINSLIGVPINFALNKLWAFKKGP
ncbi:GtrA family protein [Lachnospiraceae bacterium MD1]|uniref:GtrA family protein n=2 Tax=Variimorphobacter saccharofermentans TaxID=2755051 RepID=A0A839JYV2_9FIRM|nr:GtrA family protein [Variimorphobacter saccharofermentans]